MYNVVKVWQAWFPGGFLIFNMDELLYDVVCVQHSSHSYYTGQRFLPLAREISCHIPGFRNILVKKFGLRCPYLGLSLFVTDKHFWEWNEEKTLFSTNSHDIITVRRPCRNINAKTFCRCVNEWKTPTLLLVGHHYLNQQGHEKLKHLWFSF